MDDTIYYLCILSNPLNDVQRKRKVDGRLMWNSMVIMSLKHTKTDYEIRKKSQNI